MMDILTAKIENDGQDILTAKLSAEAPDILTRKQSGDWSLFSKKTVDSILKTIRNLIPDWALAPGEAMLTIGTGMAGSSAGGLAAIPAAVGNALPPTLYGGEGSLNQALLGHDADTVGIIEDIQGAMTYGVGYGRETTKETEAILNVVNYPLEKWSEVAKKGGEKAQDLGAWPALAAGIETALEFAPWIVIPAAYRRGRHGGRKKKLETTIMRETFDARLEAQGLSKKDIAEIRSEWTTIAETGEGGRLLAPKFVDDMKAVVAPIGTGSPKAQAVVKNYSNSLAEIDTFLSKNFKEMTLRFSADEMRLAYDAAALDELAIARGQKPTAIEELPLDLKNQVRATMAIHDAIAAEAVAAGILPYHKEGYVPRVVISTLGRKAAERIYGTRVVKIATQKARKRKYETVEETEAAAIKALGEDARVSRDFRQFALVDAELMRAVAGKKLVSEIRRLGTETGESSVKYWDGKDTPGYFRLDNPAFVETRPQIKKRPEGDVGPQGGKTKIRKDEEGEIIWQRRPLEISKEFEGPLRAALEGNPNKVYRAIMKLKSAAMQMIMISPLMHGMVIWGKALPFQPIRSLTFKNYRDGHRIENITRGDEVGLAKKAGNNEWIRDMTDGEFKTTDAYLSEMLRTGHRPIGDMGWIQRMSDVMITPKLEPGNSIVSRLVGYPAGLLGKTAQVKAMKAVDAAGHFWHDTLLWDQVRASGYGMHLNIRQGLIKKGVDPELASYVASHMANRFTGSIPFEDLSAGTRAVMNAMLFSKSFTGTNLGLYTDALRGLPRAVQNQIIENGVAIQGVGKANSAIRSAATATLMKDILGMYLLNSLTQSAISAWQKSVDVDLAGIMDGWDGKEAIDWDAVKSAVYEEITEYEAAAERWKATPNRLFEYPKLSPNALNDPGKEHRVRIGTKPDGTAQYIRIPVGKVGEDLEMAFASPLELAMNKLSPTMGFAVGLALNDKSKQRGYGIEVFDEDGNLIERLGQIAWYFMEAHTANEFVETFIDAVDGGENDAEELKKFAAMVAGFSFSQGAPGGPALGHMYEVHDRALRIARRAARKAKPLLEAGEYQRAMEILIRDGEMMPAQAVAWLKRKLAPQSALTEQRLTDFYLHATAVEKSELERILKKEFKLN